MSVNLVYGILSSFFMDSISSFFLLKSRNRSFYLISKKNYTLYLFKKFFTLNLLNSILFFITILTLYFLNVFFAEYILLVILFPLIIVISSNIVSFWIIVGLPLFVTPYITFFVILGLLIRYVFSKNLPLTEIQWLPSLSLSFLTPLLISFNYSFMDSINETSILLIGFMWLVQFENIMTLSKVVISNHRSRFLMYLMRSKDLSLSFLNRILRSTLFNIIASMAILLVLFLAIQKKYLPSIIIALCFVFMLLSIFDILVFHNFLKHSKLYSSRLGRFLSRYFPLLTLSWLLLFKLMEPYITISFFISIGFLLWFLLWILFYSYRHLRLFRKSLIISSLILVLVGCSKPLKEPFEVVSFTPLFFGKMESQFNQEVIVPLGVYYDLKVQNGMHVEKDVLVSIIHYPEIETEIKRIQFQIDQSKASMNGLSSFEKKAVKEKISQLEFELGLLKDKCNMYAMTNGIVNIQDDTIRILSDATRLVLKLSEPEYALMQNLKEFSLHTLDDKFIQNASIESSVLIQKEKNPYYEIMFNNFEHTLLPYQTVLLKPLKQAFLVPSNYVIEKENNFYVRRGSDEIVIKGSKQSDSFEVVDGLSEGDILYPYE